MYQSVYICPNDKILHTTRTVHDAARFAIAPVLRHFPAPFLVGHASATPICNSLHAVPVFSEVAVPSIVVAIDYPPAAYVP